MVTDGQVRRMRCDLEAGISLARAAGRTGMSEKTARYYRDHPALPCVRKPSRGPRTYRTRVDPFAAVWPTVEARLRAEPPAFGKKRILYNDDQRRRLAV